MAMVAPAVKLPQEYPAARYEPLVPDGPSL
jgi:hypothetical protein